MTSTTQKSFYLHSSQNRRLYPVSDYPITHLLHRRNIHHRRLEQPIYKKNFHGTFNFLVFWTLAGAFFFQFHVQVYNAMFGPSHFTQKQFVKYVNQFKNSQSFLSKFGGIKYIQVELNEDNIQNSISQYDTIRQFSDSQIRDDHIATFKRIKHPFIYVKLPTNSQKYFHRHHPIRFQSYSIQTLQCIVRNLPRNSAYTYQTWTEKSEYIQYINEEYAKNSTEFNKAVLTKCGVLIGYLDELLYERAFTGRGEHKFTSYDIVLNMTDSYYYSYFLYLFYGIIFIVPFLICLKNFSRYLSNIIKFKLFRLFGICLFSLELSPKVIEQLRYLNINGLPHEPLLELDRLIKESSYKYWENLVIIRNDSGQLFVVLLKMGENKRSDRVDKSSPFSICPVIQIRKITHTDGICCGKDLSWIRWPVATTGRHKYANWLHHQLLGISDNYKRRITLINEENNIQRSKIEQQRMTENMNNRQTFTTPATAEFIAEFRLQHEHNIQVVNMDMMNEQNTCAICLEDLTIGEVYARWPCSGAHLFHYDCMQEVLRTSNTCPICREKIKDIPTRS
ncbi:unnamed protein product [Adineta steineri]|uniref:RING-type domain-containing protein n=1 Tax=Adineta steineri TaxID=433720 RepID=A0A813SBX6_9BILA|nr:unnamed protein product [Adineta steineri]